MRCKECGYESEEMYYTIQRLEEELRKEREENRKLSEELDSANWKIRYELEPRIKRENNAYDRWATREN